MTRLATRLLLLLLALDVVLAWLAMAGAVIFVERAWLALGGYAIPEASLAEHARQLAWVRGLQVVALGATAVGLAAWARRARPFRSGTPRWLLGGWGAAILAAIAIDVGVRALAALGRAPLAPGGPLPLYLLGEVLKIAALVVTMVVVWRVPAPAPPRL